MNHLLLSSFALLLAGTFPPDREPIITTRAVTSSLPGEPCTESVEVCVPYWRAIFEKRGTGLVALHIDHSEEDSEEKFVVVSSLAPGGPGDRAGIRKGDRVLAINGIELSPDPGSALPRALLSIDAGEEATYLLERGGETLKVSFVSTPLPPRRIENWLYKCVAETFGYSAGESFRRQSDSP